MARIFKKVLTLLICIAAMTTVSLLNITIASAEDTEGLYCRFLSFLNDQSLPADTFWVTPFTESNYITTRCIIDNTGHSAERKYTFVAALYDENNRLLNVASSSGTVAEGGKEVPELCVNVSEHPDAHTIKAFLWNENLQPLIPYSAVLNEASNGQLVLRSGFENNVTITNYGTVAHINGTDNTVLAPSNWSALTSNSKIGKMGIQFGDTSPSTQVARIVNDTTVSGNKVLEFSVPDGRNDKDRERVQMNFYENEELTEVYYKFRMYIDEGFNTLKSYPETFSDLSKAFNRFRFLALFEFWNQRNWTDGGGDSGFPADFPFRISVGIAKTEEGEGDLYFTVAAQIAAKADPAMDPNTTPMSEYWELIWSATNTDYPLPVGQWTECEIWYRQGDEYDGRFYFAITPDGGSKTVIFNVENYTYSPYMAEPQGLEFFNPFKLYVSRALAQHAGMENGGSGLTIYWDDVEIWTD